MATNYQKKLTDYKKELDTKYADFDYNAEQDEMFKLTRKQLEREQASGVSDTLARYAANTGMGGSSEAMAAAQQTASRYNSMIADAMNTAEQNAYDRWSAERASLEKKIASTHSEALADAETRASFGDWSGYQALGYDTSRLEAQRAAEQEQAARKNALDLYETTGDASALKELGISVPEKTHDFSKSGKNGMSRQEYEDKMAIYDKQLSTYDTTIEGGLVYSDEIEAITRQKEDLFNSYYGISDLIKTKNGFVGYTNPAIDDELDEKSAQALIDGYRQGKELSAYDYDRLMWYYRRKGGAAYLDSIGVYYGSI